jgi:glycosyltransferase involved in cell wall biosynthesis
MRILLVHQNFPGQFVHLAPALIERGHQVLALTGSNNPNQIRIPVARYAWEPKAFDADGFKLAKTFADMSYRGEAVAAAAQILSEKHGFIPDVVFGTPGWGEMLFLPQVWPQARRLLYGEFFYAPDGPNEGFDPEFQKTSVRSRIAIAAGCAHLLMSSVDAHKILAPTRWQAQSFPDYLQKRLSVIHDGIDTVRVTPDASVRVTIPGTDVTLESGDELLTLINRNLEPSRGFHIFMRALPAVLKARPNARVVIIGGDERSYSPLPGPGKTWRQVMLDEVGGQLDLSRVHFVGKVPYQTFVDLMRVTRVHAYLTYPFVLSWSLLEAMSAGAFVIGSRTPPVEEVIKDGVNGCLVDFFDVPGWSAALIDALANPEKADAMRLAARKTVVDGYDLRSVCLPKLIEFVEHA